MANKKSENADLKDVTTSKKVVSKSTSSKKSTTVKNEGVKKASTTKKEVKPTAKKTDAKKKVQKVSPEPKKTDTLKEEAKEVQPEIKDVKPEIKEEKKTVKVKKDKGKKFLVIIIFILLLIIAGLLVYLFVFNKNDKKPKDPTNPTDIKLPKPELDDGERGKLGIDKNVNEKTIDKYLGRKDAVYRDMRMLEDPADYEAIEGDRFLSGYIKGFEVVPLPYIIPVTDLPKEVGYTYSGDTLFFKKSDGTYLENYKESMDIIEDLFPKDKIIFLMCGGGGYAGMMKQFLVENGWNKDKIYVVGGYWYYNGKNKIEVPKKANNEYDFSSVPYHDIEFSDLTKKVTDRHNKGDITKFYLDDDYYKGKDEIYNKLIDSYENLYDNFFKDVKWDELSDKEYEKLMAEYDELYEVTYSKVKAYINNLLKEKKSFVIGIYNDAGCGNPDKSVSHEAIKFGEKNGVYFYEAPSSLLMDTDLYYDVQYFPNVIIIKDGKVYTYLDYSSDEDEKMFDSADELNKWISKYIYLTK